MNARSFLAERLESDGSFCRVLASLPRILEKSNPSKVLGSSLGSLLILSKIRIAFSQLLSGRCPSAFNTISSPASPMPFCLANVATLAAVRDMLNALDRSAMIS